MSDETKNCQYWLNFFNQALETAKKEVLYSEPGSKEWQKAMRSYTSFTFRLSTQLSTLALLLEEQGQLNKSNEVKKQAQQELQEAIHLEAQGF